MENRRQQILEEIMTLMSSIRYQMEELEMKVQQLQDAEYPDAAVADEMEMEIISEPYAEPVVENESEEADDDLPFYDDMPQEEVEDVEEYPVVEEVDDLPVEDEPVHSPVPVIDAMIEKQAWRTDMPGTPVKDIRSAISLNDRILFINFLFNEDPMAFQEMLTKLNSMPSFDDAVDFAVSVHPEWDLESDTVYRFMMALRRRLQ